MGLKIKINGVTLPSPTEITSTNEIIWSANTGRSTASGKMLGDVIAEKQTFSIKWGILTKAEQQLIVKNIKSGFHPVSFVFDDETVTLSVYRGTISSVMLGYVGDGNFYYKSVACDIIEQ
ncbi:MAG: hypothetical protein IKB62_04350 [Oscillospiraceae bacterium]|nr:hypothetical protein [Oscillospiraceae bacterium]